MVKSATTCELASFTDRRATLSLVAPRRKRKLLVVFSPDLPDSKAVETRLIASSCNDYNTRFEAIAWYKSFGWQVLRPKVERNFPLVRTRFAAKAKTQCDYHNSSNDSTSNCQTPTIDASRAWLCCYAIAIRNSGASAMESCF